MSRRSAMARRLLLGTLLGALLGGEATGQEPLPADTPRAAVERPASPPLPEEHWAVRAARRAEALGLVTHYLPAQRSVPRAAVGAALGEAARRAPGEAPHLAAVSAGWWERFAEEFPEAAGGDRAVGLLGSAAGAGYDRRGGVAAPGAGLFSRRTGITHLPDRSTPVAAATLAAGATPYLAVVAEPEISEDGVRLPRWDVVAGWRKLALSAGTEPVGYGPGRGGGVVFSGGAALPRVQVETSRPLVLPGWLRLLGPVSGHTFLTRLDEARHPGDPFLLGMRAAIRPHPRFTAAVNRGSMFGGDSVSHALNAGNVGRMLLGLLTGDFENQVVSADFTFRAPTERVLPLTLYLEWGAEDAAGAWWDVPARVVGAFTPAVPGAPQLSLGAEYTHFSLYCCGNPPWYLHAGQRGGWAARDVPLGHPLGGEGSELLLYGSADLLEAALRLDGRAFRRERGREGYDTFVRAGNLFAPERAGTSHGVQLDGAWRFARGAELRVTGLRELGEGWAAHQFSVRMLKLF